MSHKPECDEKWEHDKDHCICNWIEKAEQRIIKLLERLEAVGSHPLTSDYLDTDKLIALIKGENK